MEAAGRNPGSIEFRTVFAMKTKRTGFFRSLRFRIMVTLIIIGIVPAIITSFVIVRGYENRAIALRASNIRNQCDVLVNSIVTENYLEDQSSEVLNSELSLLSTVYSGRILLIDSHFKVVKDTYDLDTGKTSVSKEVISCFQTGSGSTHYDSDSAYIEITVPIKDTNSNELLGVLVASISTNEIAQTVRNLENIGILVSAIISVIVLVAGWIISNILVRPLNMVTKAIEDVTDGYDNEAISVNNYTETAAITDAFNQMLRRIRALDNSRQEFVSNVSHELKTPLTSMKVLADSLNGQDNVPIEIYREFMSDITQEIDRENSIIQDLLTMVRMDRTAVDLNIEKTEIGELLAQVIQRLKPIADKKNIELILDAPKKVMAEVDVTKLSLAFSNLIENGIKYNVDKGWVRVTLSSDKKYFYVNVADCGLGIAEDQIDHIFERFYRGDKSHSTTIEGTGLGLAITKNAIAMHRGIIKVQSKVGEGTTFMVRLPLVHTA